MVHAGTAAVGALTPFVGGVASLLLVAPCGLSDGAFLRIRSLSSLPLKANLMLPPELRAPYHRQLQVMHRHNRRLALCPRIQLKR